MLLKDAAEDLVNGGSQPDLNEALCELWYQYADFWKGKGRSVRGEDIWTLTTLGLGSSLNDFPTLAQKIKGATCRQMFKFAANLAVHKARDPAASEYQVQSGHCAYNMFMFLDICARAELFLNDEEKASALLHGWYFLRWYQMLAVSSYNRGLCLFKLRPKLHNFAHSLLELADTSENPCKLALWAAEDLVGQMKKLGKMPQEDLVETCLPKTWFVCISAGQAGTWVMCAHEELENQTDELTCKHNCAHFYLPNVYLLLRICFCCVPRPGTLLIQSRL